MFSKMLMRPCLCILALTLAIICGKFVNVGAAHPVANKTTPLYVSESLLLKSLFSDYDKEVIPQYNSSTPVVVEVHFLLSNILEITWTDPRLAWNDTYSFEKTTVLATKIWLPDIEVFNSMTSSENSNLIKPRLYIYRNGTVSYSSHRIIHTPCEFDLLSFPFDSQTCEIALGSWSAPDTVLQVQLKQPSAHLAFFHSPVSFDVVNFSSSEIGYYYGVANESYTTIRLGITLARKGSYFYRVFVAPAAVCMFVIPIIHYLPPSSNEKLTLGGLMFVAITIMFEMVEDFFPAFSLGTVPLILHYYTALLIILFMSLLLSCLSVMVGTGESKSSRVPRFLRICCIDRLGYICCARGRTNRYDYELLHLEKALRFSAQRQTSREEDDEQELTEVTEDDVTAGATTSNHANSSQDNGMTEVLKTLINELQYARYREQVKSEWLQLAIVLDRTGGLLLLFLSIIITAVITLHSRPTTA